MHITRPSPSEHAPFAAAYIDATARALEAAGSDDLGALLAGQPAALRTLLAPAGPDRGAYAYAPGKWTLAESLVHVADTERVFSYRAMRVARGDVTPLPGFDHDAWVPESRSANRALSDILTEFDATRAATLALLRSLDDTAWGRLGVASGHPISPRALAWMMAGHCAHHLALIRDRYLTD